MPTGPIGLGMAIPKSRPAVFATRRQSPSECSKIESEGDKMDETLPSNEAAQLRQRIRKSNVRIVVTYFVVFMYCATAVGLISYLIPRDAQMALGVFNGLSTLAAGIAGFWFGNRGAGYPENTEEPGEEGPGEVAEQDLAQVRKPGQ